MHFAKTPADRPTDREREGRLHRGQAGREFLPGRSFVAKVDFCTIFASEADQNYFRRNDGQSDV